jgi:hypothetical protein
MTIATALALPPFPSVAVATKFVEELGETDIEPLGASVPSTPLMVTALALLELHVKVVLPPGLIVFGEALMLTITPEFTVTVVVAVAVVEPVPVAVAV